MEANIATPAALIGDPVRSALLLALFDGRVMPATALAWQAGVSPQTASNHLGKLVAGGLLAVAAKGRCRYYSLASPDVAHALEALAVLGPPPRELNHPHSPRARRLRDARSCYDHLAGRLGVALTDALETGGWIVSRGEDGFGVTEAGREKFAALGLDLAGLDGPKPPARPCIDWTERRRHLKGPLAARLLTRLLELGWIERGTENRAIRVTTLGRRRLRDVLGIDLRHAEAA